MISLCDNAKVFLYTPIVDMRKAIDGLSLLIVEALGAKPQSGDIFIFRNRGDKVKIIYWDRNGFVMHYKRLESSKFKFPKTFEGNKFEITQEQLSWLLAGLDFVLMDAYPELNFENYF